MQNKTRELEQAAAFDPRMGSSPSEILCGEPLNLIRPETVPGAPPQTGWEVVVGEIVALAGPAQPIVTYPGNEGDVPVKARTVLLIKEADVGQKAVLAFETGDLAKPILLGLLKAADSGGRNVIVEADEDRMVLVAEREIELRCGAASITLTRSGKVLIKGEYVLTRASGVNCIKGGAVSIN